MLDSINFKEVKPSMGFQGIYNDFYIIMDNYYEGLNLNCAFISKNAYVSPLMMNSKLSTVGH